MINGFLGCICHFTRIALAQCTKTALKNIFLFKALYYINTHLSLETKNTKMRVGNISNIYTSIQQHFYQMNIYICYLMKLAYNE